MRYLLATLLVAAVAVIGAGTASASSSSYYPTPTFSSFSYGSAYSSPFSYHVPSYHVPSYYGQLSTITGLPRTHWVSPYFRSTGTYVHGYYRSCSYCRW